MDRKNAFNIKIETSYIKYAGLRQHSLALCQKKKKKQKKQNKLPAKLTLLTHARKRLRCSSQEQCLTADTWWLRFGCCSCQICRAEHRGLLCFFATAKRAFPRSTALHYEGMNCYKFSDRDKALFEGCHALHGQFQSATSSSQFKCAQLMRDNKCPSRHYSTNSSFFGLGGVGGGSL